MHQQVRCSIRNAGGDAERGALDEGSLVDILTLLRGMNLRSAGRLHPDGGGGEFVFSIQHAEGDDHADEEARDILKGNDFEAEVYKVRSVILNHREGALLASIKRLEAELNEPVIEVYVLAAEPNGKIPVQLVTRSMLNR
jgi:hypothetical protein